MLLTHLNDPEQQTTKDAPFIKALTLADDQLIRCF